MTRFCHSIKFARFVPCQLTQLLIGVGDLAVLGDEDPVVAVFNDRFIYRLAHTST